MHTASTIDSSTDTTPGRRSSSLRREALIGAVIATTVNAVIWAVGRALGVTFHVRPESGSEVGILLVIPATLVLFAAGMWLFGRAARRSRRLAVAVLVAGVLFAVASTGGVLWAAEDAATASLLVTMHLVTGAVFAVTAARTLATSARDIRS
ncbi:DUF6069 family protein [Agromyces sp. NPDC049794]|uniref:DUF6069 family protein n=1 Tax=unclassified Agromyces TaxID=2639701 RepID=UPI0033E3607B